MKLDHIATPLLPRDIAELTQQINRLDCELNLLSEENEALQEKLGLGSDVSVDVTAVHSKRVSQLERLKKDNKMLEKEVGVAKGSAKGAGDHLRGGKIKARWAGA